MKIGLAPYECKNNDTEFNVACPQTLLVNPLSTAPVSRGGAFYFVNGKIAKQIKLDSEEVLVIEI